LSGLDPRGRPRGLPASSLDGGDFGGRLNTNLHRGRRRFWDSAPAASQTWHAPLRRAPLPQTQGRGGAPSGLDSRGRPQGLPGRLNCFNFPLPSSALLVSSRPKQLPLARSSVGSPSTSVPPACHGSPQSTIARHYGTQLALPRPRFRLPATAVHGQPLRGITAEIAWPTSNWSGAADTQTEGCLSLRIRSAASSRLSQGSV
jgi:hypothetical protein